MTVKTIVERLLDCAEKHPWTSGDREVVWLVLQWINERALRLGGMGREHDICNAVRDFDLAPTQYEELCRRIEEEDSR